MPQSMETQIAKLKITLANSPKKKREKLFTS